MAEPKARAQTTPAPEDAPAFAEEPRKIIKPVINAVNILRRLAAADEPERAIDLARHLQINPSTCFNILRTLVSIDMLKFDEAAKAYSIGPGMVTLARAMGDGHGMEAARPLIHQLAERFGATATLWRRHGEDRLVLVEVEYSTGGVRVHMPIGQRLPILIGSLGMASAAHLGRTKDQVRRGFKALRWGQPYPFDAYWAEAQAAAQRGWAVDDGQYSQGVTSVAAPVLDPEGRVIFVLASAALRGQKDPQRVAEVGEATAALARTLGDLLG